ncbi:MAG: glycosyltransferase [Chloroflexi bacterium]|nr:MAG: glycosyltransferase [Chloroflexota bacterium]
MTSRDLQGYPATRGRIREQLAVVILTYNEELNLPACLESLEGLDCDLVVVDSASTDRTVAIARQHGARVLSHPFDWGLMRTSDLHRNYRKSLCTSSATATTRSAGSTDSTSRGGNSFAVAGSDTVAITQSTCSNCFGQTPSISTIKT